MILHKTNKDGVNEYLLEDVSYVEAFNMLLKIKEEYEAKGWFVVDETKRDREFASVKNGWECQIGIYDAEIFSLNQ